MLLSLRLGHLSRGSRATLGALACWLLSGCAGQARRPLQRPLVDTLGVAVEGRHRVETGVLAEAPEQPVVRLSYSNAAVDYIAAGANVVICAEDRPGGDPNAPGNVFAVSVDGVLLPPWRPQPAARCYALALGLSPGPHHVRLVKRTETLVGDTRLWWPAGSQRTPPKARPSRKLLVLGDSITCGYGNLCAAANEPFEPRTEDATATYAAKTAHNLAMQLEVVAASGRGVWRNRCQKTLRPPADEPLIPTLFARNLPDDAGPAVPAQADAVVVVLGTNDLKAPPAGPPFDVEAFVAAYVDLLAAASRGSPGATTFVGLSPMVSDQTPAGLGQRSLLRAALSEVVARHERAGHPTVLVEFPSQDDVPRSLADYGCHYHPNVATHAAMAEVLTAAIAQARHF